MSGSSSGPSLTTLSAVSYILHLIVAVGAVLPGGQFATPLLLVALIIDLMYRDGARGSWLESHFRYRIRTVLWAALLYILTSPLWLLLLAPGWLAWGIISIWFLYRIVMGMVLLNRQQPVPGG